MLRFPSPLYLVKSVGRAGKKKKGMRQKKKERKTKSLAKTRRHRSDLLPGWSHWKCRRRSLSAKAIGVNKAVWKHLYPCNKRSCRAFLRTRDGGTFFKFNLLVSKLEIFYVNVCKNLRFYIKCLNSLLKEKNYRKEILSTICFLIKDRLTCFLCKYLLLGKQFWNLFFFTFPKKMFPFFFHADPEIISKWHLNKEL